MDVEELMKQLSEGGINVQGDFVMNKHVEYEVNNVEEGGIGIQIVNGGEITNQKKTKSASPDYEEQTDKPLCIALNSYQKDIFDKAEAANIIRYNKERGGYDVAAQSTNNLVAYLCGRIYCGDYEHDGQWKAGKRFDDAQFINQLFGFDVAGTRRTAQGSTGNLPKGYERVDRLFD